MNKKIQKILSVLVSATMIGSFAMVNSFSADGVDYKITSTYEDVNWSTYKQYKTDLHNHTTASDGHITKTQNIEAHYESDFDIQAIADHGTVDYGWDSLSANRFVHVFTNLDVGIDPISATGIAANGNTYTYDGTYYTQYDSNGTALQKMMRVPYGNEQNPTSFNNAHICSWFVDYGNESLGGTSDYENIVKNVDKLGGLCVINHPGEYTGARHVGSFDEAYNTDNIKFNYYVTKFEKLLVKYPDALIGLDINSKGDNRTRFDRKLWDTLLQRVIPQGRNVFGIATTDAHNLGVIDSGYTMMCMPEQTVDALKTAMQTGAFFACSYSDGSPVEINAWSNELKEAGVGLELADRLATAYEKICKEEIEEGEQDTIFDFDTSAAVPGITSVKVDDVADTITISTKNAYLVHWVADGEIIAVGNTIDLDDYSDEIGSYVRAEVIGEGGVMYTQPFTLEYSGAPTYQSSGFFYDFGGVVSAICDTIVKVFGFVLKYTGIVPLLWHISVQ